MTSQTTTEYLDVNLLNINGTATSFKLNGQPSSTLSRQSVEAVYQPVLSKGLLFDKNGYAYQSVGAIQHTIIVTRKEDIE